MKGENMGVSKNVVLFLLDFFHLQYCSMSSNSLLKKFLNNWFLYKTYTYLKIPLKITQMFVNNDQFYIDCFEMLSFFQQMNFKKILFCKKKLL